MNCPFCHLPSASVVAESSLCVAIRDKYPVSNGHTLIIPRRHIAGFFEITREEREDLMALLEKVKNDLDATHAPAGYNIGINDGPAAGQTIAHLHIHLIPRYQGDQKDARGGIRRIFPEQAAYWKA